jgi:serine/threonine protein kinase
MLTAHPANHAHSNNKSPGTFSIFLEYVSGGSVRSLLDRFGTLSEDLVKNYTRQLLLGLEYLHNNGIAHRDIKAANVLIANDGIIKLADFGAAKRITRGKSANALALSGDESAVLDSVFGSKRQHEEEDGDDETAIIVDQVRSPFSVSFSFSSPSPLPLTPPHPPSPPLTPPPTGLPALHQGRQGHAAVDGP